MKFLPLLLLVLISLLAGCTSEPTLTIEFCESLTENDQCPGGQNQFTLGKPVYVRLSSNEPFESKTLTGKIIRMEEERTIELADKTFELEPGDTYITQSIPFQEFGSEALGTFSIEFSDENDSLLAKRELVITR